MNTINPEEARKKHVPTEKEKKEILEYLKANPTDREAVPTLMKKYNCSEMSIMVVIMKDEI